MRDRSQARCILVQSQVATVLVIVADVSSHEPDEMTCTENHDVLKELAAAAADPPVRSKYSCVCLLFIHPPAHGSEVSPAARNTLDSARIPRASKLLICGLFQKGRVLAQDGEARDDAADLLPRVMGYWRTPQNLPASLLEELSRLVRYGSSGKMGKYEATRLRRREAMLSGSPRSSRLDVALV